MANHRVYTLGLVAALVLSFGCGSEPINMRELRKKVVKTDLSYLSSDSLEGRGTGSEGERKAAEYIMIRMGNIGLVPKGDSAWYQDFTFRPHPPVRKTDDSDTARLMLGPVKSLTGRNVLGALDKGHDQWIVIGAHYDHLGRGDENSLAPGDSSIHKGADDNASGVAALLELAQRFYDEPVNYNILFAAFSGEEKGLIGSKTFVESPSIPKEKISFMLNMDMVGRMNSERALAVYGTGTSPAWSAVLDSANVDSLKFMYHESGVGPSDHTSFYLADIPVLHFFTGQHEDYHKPTDVADKINYDGLHSVINTVEAVVRELNGQPKLAFTKTKDQSKDDTPSFKVTLGIVPDYMYEGTGMRIDGVSEDRPAHKAGIIKGDIIVRMGDIEVNDIYAYMGGLAKFAPGETTPVTVLRGGEEKTFDVLWD